MSSPATPPSVSATSRFRLSWNIAPRVVSGTAGRVNRPYLLGHRGLRPAEEPVHEAALARVVLRPAATGRHGHRALGEGAGWRLSQTTVADLDGELDRAAHDLVVGAHADRPEDG